MKEGDSKVLAALVAVSTSIRNLELDHNPLGSGVWNIINETPKGTIKRITFKFCEIEMTDMAKVDAALRISSVRYVLRPYFRKIASLILLKSELDLSDNNLGDGGFVAICRRVAQNTSLERLLLASNNITDKSPTGIFPTEIMSLSFCSSNLQFLDLQRNFIKEDGCLRILDLMKERTLVSKIPLVIAVSERISTPVFQQIMGKSKGGKGKKSKKRGKNI